MSFPAVIPVTREEMQAAACEKRALRVMSQWCREEYEMAGRLYVFERQNGVWVLTQEGDIDGS